MASPGSLSANSRNLLLLIVPCILTILAWGYLQNVEDTGPKAPRRSLYSPGLTSVVPTEGHVCNATNSPPRLRARLADEDYTCGPDRPCRNGACCGASGFCGYGETYCGSGCVSNCDAHAECGKDALVPGTTCSLNTCCSEFGFCGTTEEFCQDGCQSNCVLHPEPPGGSSTADILTNRVIGYYESWSARKSCHKVAPVDIAVDALTHVNFAFAFIEPGSYNIVPMDSQTPESLFKEVPNLKSIKPSLKVFISIGGWTFSDNDTVTQPLFGEIAASEANRQTFASNCVKFMRQYGYDGVDIDWEYPGAPDRGGKDEDVENFVLLMQTLRQVFDASGSTFGITFTAPSSYWYLRWFDLPGLLKHVDWINLMSYDLHGVWDRDNPIGNIVQAHTNLTEIKLAAELFWRVGVPPAKLAMGFGFYGRAFTLESSDCTEPGCRFKGASDPGPCTGEGGILGHYEIQALLASSDITPVWDKKAAVKYATIDGDQWVSFDDKETYKQKVDWANDVGLAGALIWASDLDDDKYNAHSWLMNRQIKSTSLLADASELLADPNIVAKSLAGSNGQDCFRNNGDCVDLDDRGAMARACGSGYTPVGWDDAGCGKKSCHCGKPICCPVLGAPKDCIWRGDNTGSTLGSDCSAQCFAGEVNIKGLQSHWGGGFLNDGDTNRCGRGEKAFCCPSLDYGDVTRGCKYTSCTGSCPSDTEPLFSKNDNCYLGTQYYCCPKPVQLKECRWEEGSKGTDCVNAVCNGDEIEIDRAQYGEWLTTGCSWGRKKAACCKIDKAPPKPAYCTHDVCDTIPGLCSESSSSVAKRDGDGGPESSALEKRGNAETYYVDLGNNIGIRIIALAYPGLAEIFGLPGASRVLRRFFRLIPGYCTGRAVDVGTIPGGDNPGGLTGLEAEHPIDRQVMKGFPPAACNGVLRSGATADLNPISRDWFKNYWHAENAALASRPPIGSAQGVSPDTPNDRVMEAFGSRDYPDPFLPTGKQINGAKGSFMRMARPATPERITGLAATAVRSDAQEDADALLSTIRAGFAVFEYMNQPEAAARFNMVRRQVRLQFQYIEEDVPGAAGLAAWWDLFADDYFAMVGDQARTWANDVILAAATPFEQARQDNRNLRIFGQVVGALEEMLDAIGQLRLPADDTMPLPQPPGGGS